MDTYHLVFLIVSAVPMTMLVVEWGVAASLYRRNLLNAVLLTAPIVTRSKKRRMFKYAIFMLLVVPVWFGFLTNTMMVISMLSVATWTMSHMFVPPGILVLGPSSSQAVTLTARLTETELLFYNITCLLEPTLEVSAHWVDRKDVGNMTMRTLRPVDWEVSVQSLMDVVRLIIVDCRHISAGVEKELAWIVVSDALIAKTLVYLGTDDDLGNVEAIRTKATAESGSRSFSVNVFRIVSERSGIRRLVAEAKDVLGDSSLD